MKVTTDILEQAATWYVDLQELPADHPLHLQHQQWLQSNPLHRKAWQRVERLQQRLACLPAELSSADLENARYSRRSMIKTLAVLLAVGAVGVSQRHQVADRLANQFADYRTGTGEQHSVLLEDGTELQINTDTTLKVAFSSNQRILHLRQGEIMVTTASDARPFSVHTRHGSIRALGTRFQVYSTVQQTRVGVYEHGVEIRSAHSEQSLTLHSGEQAHFNDAYISPASPLAANADSWTSGMLIVSDWALGDFLDDLDRYYPGRISYTPAAAELRISGAFHLNNPHAILASLSASLPIEVRHVLGYWVRVSTS